MLTGNEFLTLGAENWKAQDPNVKLWRGTESWWELDECRDLVGMWCCKRSERYGGRPVSKALKVKVASLNDIRHSTGSQSNCLKSLFEDSGNVWECWYKTTRAAARWIRRKRAVCLSQVPHRIEFNWSRHEELSADVTQSAVFSSNDEQICLKEQMW